MDSMKTKADAEMIVRDGPFASEEALLKAFDTFACDGHMHVLLCEPNEDLEVITAFNVSLILAVWHTRRTRGTCGTCG